MVVRELGFPGSGIFEYKNVFTEDECKLIIQKFDADERKAPGVIYRPDDLTTVDPNVKESIDLIITGLDDWKDIHAWILERIRPCVNGVRALMPALDFTIWYEPFKLKRIDPGMKGFDWHCDNASLITMDRQLALIVYFNDVEEGGETEFQHQGISVKPERGKVVVFPPFWTHRHRGCPTVSGPKYIMTDFLRYK